MTIKDFITKHEGRKKKPYKCSAGFKTIGVGYNMDANPLPPPFKDYLDEYGEITEEMIDQLLGTSIQIATADCEDLFPGFDDFSDNRRMALVDFLFNIGKKRAMGFAKAVHAINIGHWDTAADEMIDSNWYKQVKGRAVEVVRMVREG